MKLGPVTSKIYNRMKPQDEASTPTFWSSHIQRHGLLVTLKTDPGKTELSPAEENVIAKIYASDGAADAFVLADKCHQQFPEWVNPGSTSTPLEISEIIKALGLSEDEAANIETLISLQRAVAQVTA
jgi:hypothetical protein